MLDHNGASHRSTLLGRVCWDGLQWLWVSCWQRLAHSIHPGVGYGTEMLLRIKGAQCLPPEGPCPTYPHADTTFAIPGQLLPQGYTAMGRGSPAFKYWDAIKEPNFEELMSLLQKAGLVHASPLGVQKAGQQNEPSRHEVFQRWHSTKSERIPAGAEICDKCRHPDHWDTLLFNTIISLERFGVVAAVLQSLSCRWKHFYLPCRDLNALCYRACSHDPALELKLCMKSPCLVSCIGPLKSNKDGKCFIAVFAIDATELLTALIRTGQSTLENERSTL